MVTIQDPVSAALKVFVPLAGAALLLGGVLGWAGSLKREGGQAQLQKDAPVVAAARGDALTAETQAAITEAIRQDSEDASKKLTTNQAKEVHYVETIRAGGPSGLPDDDWRVVIAGMRADVPRDSIPPADQREPAAAPH